MTMHRPEVLARNALWNLASLVLPLLVAIVTIPLLIKGMGAERFGILTLAWVVIGYFSLFDLGIGRAVTKLVAEHLGHGKVEQVPALFWTALTLMALLGVAGAVTLILLAPWLATKVLSVPASLQADAIRVIYLLSFALPFVITTTGLRGTLEGYQKFGMISILRLSLGIFTYVSPLLVLPFTSGLVPITAILVVARIIIWSVHLWLCLYMIPGIKANVAFVVPLVKSLIGFGGWLTVSNIVSPMMVYFDRFVIAAIVSTTAVAYYTTPYEVVIKLLVIPAAISAVVFPSFAGTFSRDKKQCGQLFTGVVKYIALALFPVVLMLVAFSGQILSWWVGAKFAIHSAFVLQCLAIGVFFNCLAQIPFVFIQGAGRPDLTAKLHLTELPIYALILWFLTKTHGIDGAAIAWAIRAGVDAVVLFMFAFRLLSENKQVILAWLIPLVAVGFMFAVFAELDGTATKAMLMAGVLPAYAVMAWLIVLDASERLFVRRSFKMVLVRLGFE